MACNELLLADLVGGVALGTRDLLVHVVEREATIALVVEARLRPGSRVMAATTVCRATDPELARVPIYMTVGARLADDAAKSSRSRAVVALRTRDVLVRPGQRIPGPQRVVELRTNTLKRVRVMATCAAFPAIELTRLFAFIEATAMDVVMAGFAVALRADELAHTSDDLVVAGCARHRIVGSGQRKALGMH